MDEKKNPNRSDQGPQHQSSPKPDPRQDEPRWNDRHPQAPLRDQPQERGTTTSGGARNRSSESDRQSER